MTIHEGCKVSIVKGLTLKVGGRFEEATISNEKL